MILQKMALHNMGHGFYNNPQYRHNLVEALKDPKWAWTSSCPTGISTEPTCALKGSLLLCKETYLDTACSQRRKTPFGVVCGEWPYKIWPMSHKQTPKQAQLQIEPWKGVHCCVPSCRKPLRRRERNIPWHSLFPGKKSFLRYVTPWVLLTSGVGSNNPVM